MSLDVSLYQQKEKRCPHCNELIKTKEKRVYSSNITHNLGKMADNAGLYEALWRPYMMCDGYIKSDDYDKEYEFESKQVILAKMLIEKVEKGLKQLKSNPEYYKTFDSPNGWGIYEHFVPFVENYLNALKEYPNARVEVSR